MFEEGDLVILKPHNAWSEYRNGMYKDRVMVVKRVMRNDCHTQFLTPHGEDRHKTMHIAKNLLEKI